MDLFGYDLESQVNQAFNPILLAKEYQPETETNVLEVDDQLNRLIEARKTTKTT